ncbi:putative inactive receptor kinase [Hibiscus syriacus]|uniref:Inactive receptor kinase n=1 Tax=Hibiscus syriacus TaxID=106335 RepID=A0A6A2XQF4_HIBSY|nr:putative inactive receptor kinase [Hibiscus syriacus]
MSKIKHANRIQWNSSTSACDWVGVKCGANRSFVHSLRLPGVALIGSIPPNTISRLSQLRILSLRANRLSGEIPADFSNLTLLHHLYLQGNEFTGVFPPSVTRLTRLDLSSNNFTASTPTVYPFSMFQNSLSKFPESSFAGNLGLCGRPLPPSPSPQTTSGKNSKKLSAGAIVAIAVGSAIAAVPHEEAGTSSSKDDITGGSTEVAKMNKLVFSEGSVYSFDLEDLLRASAEVLGKGSVGTSYNVVLAEGTTVVAKRLKDVAVSKREFDKQMKMLGKIQHENVVPLRAFYYSQYEKLLVSDFMPHGSLSALLHGSMVLGRRPLHWEHRMRIALTVARCLAYLHDSVNMVHGNLKSSNILLRPDYDACISNFGLNSLFCNTTLSSRIVELLTGKSSDQTSIAEEGIDLPRWVQSVLQEECTADVFVAELMAFQNIEEEMVQLLEIAMDCISTMPDRRPIIANVIQYTSFRAKVESAYLAVNVKTHLSKQEQTMSSVNAVLLDAQWQQHCNEKLRLCMWKLRYIFYDAEGAINDFKCETFAQSSGHDLYFTFKCMI